LAAARRWATTTATVETVFLVAMVFFQKGASGSCSRCWRWYSRCWAGVHGVGPPGGGKGHTVMSVPWLQKLHS